MARVRENEGEFCPGNFIHKLRIARYRITVMLEHDLLE